jgi:hypothetical protein
LLERFLELLERVRMLDCGGERSIGYQVAQLLVNLLDLCAGRVAYPINEPDPWRLRSRKMRSEGERAGNFPL